MILFLLFISALGCKTYQTSHTTLYKVVPGINNNSKNKHYIEFNFTSNVSFGFISLKIMKYPEETISPYFKKSQGAVFSDIPDKFTKGTYNFGFYFDSNDNLKVNDEIEFKFIQKNQIKKLTIPIDTIVVNHLR